MILQPLNNITVGKVKCFTGENRFKLTKMLAIQYKSHHHIRYVLVNTGGVKLYLKNNGLITDSQLKKFYVRRIQTMTENVKKHKSNIYKYKHKPPGYVTVSY
jgi:hypothetical protein